jgi:uncharacterized membrane protein
VDLSAAGKVLALRKRAALLATLLAAGALAIVFLALHAFRYLTYDPGEYGPVFWPRRFGLLPHIGGGIVALLVGLPQLWLGVRGSTGRLHRNLGRLYVGAIGLGCASGYYLSFTALDPPGWSYRTGLFFLTLAWTLTTATAYLAIRRGDLARHRRGMIRSYVVTFAFVFFRFADRVLEAAGVGTASERAIVLIWAVWAVPLLLTEVALDLGGARKRAT